MGKDLREFNGMNIKRKIIEHHISIGYKTDEKGYVKTIGENLLAVYPNWDDIKQELENSNGNELSIRNNRIKFQAVHSSSTLCVNSFAMIKLHKKEISLFKTNGFLCAEFEKKLNTGISTPNLDFYLANDMKRIGIESKFTEILKSKLPNKNLEKYLLRDLKLPEGLNDAIKYYMNCDEKIHLDAAQLLKHIIGLLTECFDNHSKTASLIYLYWLPLNWRDIAIYQKHEEEIKTFKEKVSGVLVPVYTYSYIEFLDMLEKNKNMENTVKKLKERYLFEI
jgi:hypothetical protein